MSEPTNAASAGQIIVIGRQFGAGGRAVGHRLAELLGLEYYDRELLRQAAVDLGFAPEVFDHTDERRPSVFQGMLSLCYGVADATDCSSMTGSRLYQAQSRVIEALGEKGGCVIVGRTADYVLRDRESLLSVFLHAPVEWRAARIMARGEAPDLRKAADKALKNDRCRERYYNYFSGRRWGDASNYDLSVDCSMLGVERTASLLAHFAAEAIVRS